jgi:hypothetical protein
MTAASPEAPVVDRPETTVAEPHSRPVVDDDVGAKDVRVAFIILGVPAFVALALGIILGLT